MHQKKNKTLLERIKVLNQQLQAKKLRCFDGLNRFNCNYASLNKN